MPTPNPGNYGNRLNGLSVVDSNDAWAVGASFRIPPDWLSLPPSPVIQNPPPIGVAPLVLHWDGRSWKQVEAPNLNVSEQGGELVGGTSLVDVAARSADDVWAVGGGGSPVIEHWDGHRWSVVPSPRANLVNATLVSVSADAADDAWAAGSGDGPVIEHWDGDTWTVSPVAVKDTRSTTVDDVVALSPTDVWAVGQEWDKALVLHWDGRRWSEVPSPKVRATSLSELLALSPDDVWAVGNAVADVDGNGPTQGLLEHWDGSRWSLIDLPALTMGTALGSVTSVGADDMWVAGGRTRSDGSVYAALFLRHSGDRWTVVKELSSAPAPRRIAGTRSGQVWSIGSRHVGSRLTAFVAALCE